MRGSPRPASSTAWTSSLRRHVLEQVAGGAEAQRGVEVVVALGDREDQHLDAGMALAQRGACLEARQLGHVEVEQDDVGGAALGQGQGLAPVAGQAGDLDALVGAQQRRGPLAHQAVVVDHEHGDRPVGPSHRATYRGGQRWRLRRRLPRGPARRPRSRPSARSRAPSSGPAAWASWPSTPSRRCARRSGLRVAALYLPEAADVPILRRFAVSGAESTPRPARRAALRAGGLAAGLGRRARAGLPRAGDLARGQPVRPARLGVAGAAARRRRRGRRRGRRRAAPSPGARGDAARRCSPSSATCWAPASPPRACASASRAPRSSASACAWRPTSTTAWPRTSRWPSARSRCWTPSRPRRRRARAARGCARRSARRTASCAPGSRTSPRACRSAACATPSRRPASARASAGCPSSCAAAPAVEPAEPEPPRSSCACSARRWPTSSATPRPATSP